MSVPKAVKAVVEAGLVWTMARPERTKGRALVLAYHNVVPDDQAGRGDQSLHLPLSRFVRHLDLLQATCRVVSLHEALEGARSAQGPTVAITFDDAYRGAVELALPELARRKLAATLFVAPGLLGLSSFWWDDLASRGGFSTEIRRRALQAHQGRDDLIRPAARAASASSELPALYGGATEAQVHALGRLGTVTLGSHSWSHCNLAAIEAADLTEELSRPLEWLRATSCRTIPALAYPYGLSSEAVELATERAGYRGGLLIEGGWLDGVHSWAIPRFNIPSGLSERGLMLRLCNLISPGGGR